MYVSLIATVLNEAHSLDILFGSLLRQTRLPDQVVIVDGGSRDGTWGKLQQFAERAPFEVQVDRIPGANISQGRNAAIARAKGDVIAATDAGVRLEERWLEYLVAPFEQEDAPDVVSGFFVPDPHSLFERVLGATTLPRLAEIDPSSFYPSSRSVAFRKAAWEAVGGYPEWLDYCEDLLFDFALADAGYRFAFIPEARVHFRPRSSLWAFIKQYYRYARGDGKADFWRYRHLVRYGTYVGGAALCWLAFSRPIALVALALGFGVMMRSPFLRLAPWLQDLDPLKRFQALAWMVLIRISGDLAKMAGYPVGMVWRWRHRPQGSWPKRQWK